MDESIGSIENNNVNYQEPNNAVIQIEPKKNGRGRIKKALLVVIILSVLGGTYYIYSNTELLKCINPIRQLNSINTGDEVDNKTGVDLFCEKNNGKLDGIGKNKICFLGSGNICTEELYYKGECPTSIYAKHDKPEEIFCEKSGGKIKTDFPWGDGVGVRNCYLSNGIICPLEEFYKGVCPLIKKELNNTTAQELNCPGREKIDGKIYNNGEEINFDEVDIPSFIFIDCNLAKDKNNIYTYEFDFGGGPSEMKKISKQIDVSSFRSYEDIYTTNDDIYCGLGLKWLGKKVVDRNQPYQKYSPGSTISYLRLGNKIYYNCDEVIGANADSFSLVTDDEDHIIGKDKEHIYIGSKILPLISPNNFQLKKIGEEQFIKNDNIIYLIIAPDSNYSKVNADPASFGLRDELTSYNIFKDGKGMLFYACGNGPNPYGEGYRVKEIIKIEGINPSQLNIINSENLPIDVYGILEDDKYRYTIKCDQEEKVIKTSK